MNTFGSAVAMTAGASQIIAAAPTKYKGLTVRETGGVTLTLRLWDNPAAASGTLIETITVAANGSANIYLPDLGVVCTSGLYLERVTAGTYEGSVRLG